MIDFRRCLPVLLLVLVASGFLLFSLDESAKISAQGPPYFPLQPSWFNVVGTKWNAGDIEINAAPGDTNIPLTVSVQNIGNSTVTGLSETLVLQSPFTNASGGQLAKSFYEGSVSPGSTGTTTFILNINRDAAPGEYVLAMQIEYLVIASGVGQTLYIARQAEINVPVLIGSTHYVPIYSVNLLPKQVQPSGNVTVSGNVVDTATSSSFYNTNVSISSPAFTKTTSIFIGQIDPNIPRPFSATFQVQKNLPNGTYPVTIIVTYQDTSNIGHFSSSVVTLRVQQQTFEPPARQSERGPIEILISFLRRIFDFFFGSTIATVWKD